MKTPTLVMKLTLATLLATGLAACSGENNPLASISSSASSLVSADGVMEPDIGKATALIVGKISKGDLEGLEAFWKLKETMPPVEDKEAMLKKGKELFAYQLKNLSTNMQRIQSTGVTLDTQEKHGRQLIQNYHLTGSDGKPVTGNIAWAEFGVKGYVVNRVRIDR